MSRFFPIIRLAPEAGPTLAETFRDSPFASSLGEYSNNESFQFSLSCALGRPRCWRHFLVHSVKSGSFCSGLSPLPLFAHLSSSSVALKLERRNYKAL